MKVLVLGMPRTGTQSVADALSKLGIAPVYHMREVGKHQHESLWIEALEAKFENKGDAWSTKQDFDRILEDFQGLSDVPAMVFARELISAYPDACIILTVRDEQVWYASMKATLWHAHCNFPKKPIATLYHQHLWADDFDAKGIEAYREHNDMVRQESVGRKFLEYRVGEGWEPLCQLLGTELPKEDFPRADDWVDYKAHHGPLAQK